MRWPCKQANHPPVARVKGKLQRTITPGDTVVLDADESTDPDGHRMTFEWVHYPEPGSYRGPAPTIRKATSALASFTAPLVDSAQTIHIVLSVTDSGSPPLTRYQRVIVTVRPQPR